MSYLDDLNDKQREAVEYTDGALLVVAGAGTGKTKTLTYRVHHLIQQGIHPAQILAITFTNKAASEMRERIGALHNDPHDAQPFVSTFHALGVHILRSHAAELGLPKYFTILDQADAVSALKDVMRSIDLDPKEWDPKKIKNAISRQKGNLIGPEAFAERVHSPMSEVVATLWPMYEKKKREYQAVDFDDLLYRTHELLDRHETIRNHYQNRWQYLHIDEYQDTNVVQYRLAKLLANPQNNICAVGDGDQNIYTWRGATVRNILNFEKDYPRSHVVLLERNYRSTKTILSAAHEIIRKNSARIDKELFTDNATGEQIGMYQALNGGDEAYWVAGKIKELLGNSAEPRDIAVLFRMNFQSRILEEACLAEHIPYQVVGTKFFDRKEVKDVMAYLRAARNPGSLVDVKRIINIPKRGIGKASVAKIFANQLEELKPGSRRKYEEFLGLLERIGNFANNHRVSEVVKYIIEISGLRAMYEAGGADELERLENLKELVTHATRYDYMESEGIEQFLEDVALMSDQDTMARADQEQNNRVRLMTVHAAKGLEFKYVFIVGMEQGIFPSDRNSSNDKDRDHEEARRLFYVALTRAKQKIYLSYAQIRRIFGQESLQTPSEFLSDIPDNLTVSEGSSTHHQPVRTIYLDF